MLHNCFSCCVLFSVFLFLLSFRLVFVADVAGLADVTALVVCDVLTVDVAIVVVDVIHRFAHSARPR